ncbi:zinc finger protein 654-like [Pungitius pungitius]|uniref:zinc finger protein 654-like n=1 Tax=Pungitius pungitius TaxID=134920 RepID=UPI002E165138
MAEERSVYDLEGLEKQLESLLSRCPSDEIRADGKTFCSEFRKLVEEYVSRWQVPLPQLRILEIALCYFARASTFFTPNCDHVIHTLSSLALSVFELLLFFEQKDFHQEPLNHFSVTFQECHSVLARHQNVHLVQVERLVRGGGPWGSAALHAILTESSLPQSEVDGCIGSEPPVFLELRVRYLLSCERVSEAAALARCCARHPSAGQHLFFFQVYLTWLFKTSQHDCLQREVADLNGKDAIHIICSLECEEKDELLLALSRAFLSQQLRRGDMCYLCDLVFIWSKLHSRLNTSKQALLEESNQLILSATNVNSIFPFIRAILQELGEDGIQFCVELCANALGFCLPCDVITKSLIYKTIAGLLPNDLEVSRACALLIFFLERSVETYKLVYLLYMHPDQEYQVEYSPIRNHVRFETLQVLKKDLCFDPEFWNLTALRSNCLKLMSEKVVGGALEEIMENKWILSYCAKEPASRSSKSTCYKGSKGSTAKKRHHKEDRRRDTDTASKGLKVGPGKARLHVDHTAKKKGSQRSLSSGPLRRSFWQLDRLKDNVPVGYGELRRTTRLSEKNPPKRRIRQPKWLLEDSGNLGENEGVSKTKKHGLRHQKHHGSNAMKRSETVDFKNNDKHKPAVNSHLMAGENSSKPQKGFSPPLKLAALPQVVLELSLPDNELMGTFNEDTCNRQRGFPQVLLYRPTLKVPSTSEPAKTVHRKEVILRARDTAMFVQQLHCYARRQKGKGVRPNIQGSVSTITRSSVQGSPPKEPERELSDEPAADNKGGIIALHTPEGAKIPQSPGLEKALETQTTKAASRRTCSESELSEKPAAKVRVADASETSAAAEIIEAPVTEKPVHAPTVAPNGLCDESAVEMRVTIASAAPKVAASSDLDQVSRAVKDASKSTSSSAEVFQSSPLIHNQMVAPYKIPSSSNRADSSRTGAAEARPSPSPDVLGDGRQELKSQAEAGKCPVAKADGPEVLTAVCGSQSAVDVMDVLPKFPNGHGPCENESGGTTGTSSPDRDSINDMSALTLVTEMVTELAPGALPRDLENRKLPSPEDGTSKEPTPGSKSNASNTLRTTSTCSVVCDGQGKGAQGFDPDTIEDSDLPESEESKLEYSCTFCNKVFKGSRVVEHAMFHYRKDECMFCGTMFKDDLLAMMHLSDHIEKLKRIKEADGNNETKAKTMSVSSGRRSSGRTRRSADGPKSTSPPHSTPSGSRQLRSSSSPMSADERKETPLKLLRSKAHKVNGHFGKKTNPDGPKREKTPVTQQDISRKRLQENQHTGRDSSPAKQRERAVEGERVEAQEKVCCPVEGCDWFTDLTKRAALLYHALEDHYGEVGPLEVAFRIENGKCSSCKRVMWSFEHFQHHVGRHRLSPRHPCLHRECTSRFKTGLEMRRHARRHNPLQAVCCVPGCSQLFICLWALNLHEREHYSFKPIKPDKDANKQTGHKQRNTPDGKKRSDQRPKDAPAAVTADNPESEMAPRKLRGEGAHDSPTENHSPLPAAVKEESKARHETKDLHVLKNLSNKDTSSPPAGPHLRLRQTLRKVTSTARGHKVISSSLQKQNITVRHKFKSKQVRDKAKCPKRRGRPPKSKEAVHDENTTAGPTDQSVPGNAAPLANVPKAAESPNASNESKGKEQVKDVVDPTEASINKSEKSTNEKMKNNHFKQKELLQVASCAKTATCLDQSVSSTSADKALQLTAKNLHKVRKRSAPKESRTASSKKHKPTNNEANLKTVKRKPEGKEEEAENKDSTQRGCGNSVPSAPPNCLNETTAPPTSSGEKTQEEKLKRSLVKTEGKKEKRAHSASSDSGQMKKKHKDVNKEDKKTLKGRLSDANKSCVKKKVQSKSAERQDAASSSSAATSPQRGTKKDKSKKPHIPKNSGPKEVGEKRDDVKGAAEQIAEGQAEAPPVAEEGTTTTTTAAATRPAAGEDPKCAALREALAGYSSRPYARPPPTAYLDEKYITMPKRRKDPPPPAPSSQWSPPPRQSGEAKAAGRQRCANCFATFDGAEDLQRHLQLQKCSSLFGFESDDEGNS